MDIGGCSLYARPAEPSVSVVIPCFNAERWVSRAIKACLASRHPISEVIVVDDGSTDDTIGAVRRFASDVTLISSSRGGACAARNLGWKHAASDYVVFLDADDYFDCKYISDLFVGAKCKELDVIVGCSISEFADGSRGKLVRYKESSTSAELFRGWLRGRVVQTGGLAWKRTFLEGIGGWDEKVIKGQDEELFLRALQYDPRVAVSKSENPLVWVQHDSEHRMSNRLSRDAYMAMCANFKALMRNEVLDKFKATGDLAWRFYFLSRAGFNAGYKPEARCCLDVARRLGFFGHYGSHAHVLACHMLGLEKKEAVSSVMRSVVRSVRRVYSHVQPVRAAPESARRLRLK